MVYYLSIIFFIYLAAVLARRADRRARRAFATRLGALYRARGEFWRLRVWAQEARERGDADAGARFGEQAAALLPGITGESTALRRDYPGYAGEIGWIAGMLDDELADMGRALVAAEVGYFERWTTGRGRPPLESVLTPGPTLEDDVTVERIHMAVGIVVGALGGFGAWLGIYWNDMDARLSTMFFFILVGAAVLGYVARTARDELWTALAHGVRYRGWGRPL